MKNTEAPTDETFDKDDIIDGIENMAAALETSNVSAVATWAVDATLQHVVDWLHGRGDTEIAETLEQIGDLDALV